MPGDVRDTLLLPFDSGDVVPPESGQRWCFLNARPLPDNQFAGSDGLHCEQGFRPEFLRLEQAGYRAVPQFEDTENFDGALLLLGRSRQANERNLARAWNAVRLGQSVICAGEKTAGIQSLKKSAAKRTEIIGSLSKNHAQVFWLQRDELAWPLHDDHIEVDGYEIAPGMFSADGPDKASQFLAQHFDERIAGRVADFGAGWGYLSAELLKRSSAVTDLSLFEADHRSLGAAKRNLGNWGQTPISFHWRDVCREVGRTTFDWIIMNPPFHTGRAADPDLGKAFIAAAHRALVPSGRLFMVANNHLPYEKLLKETFTSSVQIAQQGGFKIIEARR